MFVGWYLDKELTNQIDDTYRVHQSINLYAKWLKIVTTYDFDQETVHDNNVSYTWTNTNGEETTINYYNTSVYIITSTSSPHDTHGAVLLLGPISTPVDKRNAYAEFDLTRIKGLHAIEFEYSALKSSVADHLNTQSSANLKLQMKNGDEWIDVKTIDMKTELDVNKYTKVLCYVDGPGVYRLNFEVPVLPAARQYDYFGITIDNIKLYDNEN